MAHGMMYSATTRGPRGLSPNIGPWHTEGRPSRSLSRSLPHSEAEREEAACNYLARPGFARRWTAVYEREIRETRKVTARLSEQALDLKSWHDAMRSEPRKKRHARLKAGKKSAARMSRDSAGTGRPHAPHGGGGNCTLGMKSTLTLLSMPPTFCTRRQRPILMKAHLKTL